jgi:hypothetical protein
VDDDVVVLLRQAASVQDVEALEGRLLLGREPLRVPLEGVVHRLGDVEELVPPVHDEPVGLEAHVVHEGDGAVEDLRHPAAEAGGVDVRDALALERLGQRSDLGHQVPRDDAVVVGQALVAGVDVSQHAVLASGW